MKKAHSQAAGSDKALRWRVEVRDTSDSNIEQVEEMGPKKARDEKTLRWRVKVEDGSTSREVGHDAGGVGGCAACRVAPVPTGPKLMPTATWAEKAKLVHATKSHREEATMKELRKAKMINSENAKRESS